MDHRVDRGTLAWLVTFSAAWFIAASAQADTVTLNSGGVINGKVVTSVPGKHAGSITVETATGARIVVDRNSVKLVKRGATASRKASVNPTGSAKPRLTPEERSWIPKVRLLVARLLDADRDQSRRARKALLNIQDPSAIPALSQYLARSVNSEVRQLYVNIMKRMPGFEALMKLGQMVPTT